MTTIKKEVIESLKRNSRINNIVIKEYRNELHLTKKKLADSRKQIINKEETIKWLFDRLKEFEKK